MNDLKKFALIGAGGHGQAHLNTILGYQQQGRARLVAIADPFVEKLAQCHAEQTSQGVRWYQDYQKLLLEEQDLDVIVISTPIPLHEPMLQECLARTNARILLEKPPFPTIQQLQKFIALDRQKRTTVGFQMIHWPTVTTVKQHLVDGSAGTLKRIILRAGWPRPSSYYERAGWAGRLLVHGQPVFDGPATNALSHILQKAMYFAGDELHSFATPDIVRAQLFRARPIESYDGIWMHATTPQGVEIHMALAHCVAEALRFEVTLETDRGSIIVGETNEQSSDTMGLGIAQSNKPEQTKEDLYDILFLDEEAYQCQPNKLADSLGYVLATNAALISSQGIDTVPETEREVVGEARQSICNVLGLSDFLKGFQASPMSLAGGGFAWGREGNPISAADLQHIELSDFLPKTTAH